MTGASWSPDKLASEWSRPAGTHRCRDLTKCSISYDPASYEIVEFVFLVRELEQFSFKCLDPSFRLGMRGLKEFRSAFVWKLVQVKAISGSGCTAFHLQFRSVKIIETIPAAFMSLLRVNYALSISCHRLSGKQSHAIISIVILDKWEKFECWECGH